MRIVFLGSGAFGIPTLDALSARHEVVAVVSQPDKPAGRGKVLTPTPLAVRAAELGIPLTTPIDINEPSVCAAVRAHQADAWVIIAFGQKLSRDSASGHGRLRANGRERDFTCRKNGRGLGVCHAVARDRSERDIG